MTQEKPTALIILDGYGLCNQKEYNAVAQAHTPNLDRWRTECPHAQLQASGTAVGLLEGYIGNSEVGHMTIGAGRVIPQPVSIVHDAICDKSLFKNEVLNHCLEKVRATEGALHIMGLLSDAGVHSDVEHMYAFLDAAHQHNIDYVFIHAFLDGRDTPPRSAARYLEQLDQALMAFEYGSIGSLHGRYYAMDRDNHWDRTEKSYRVLVLGDNLEIGPWENALEESYQNGITDEFFMPVLTDPTATIQNGDMVININFRADRARQLTASFVDPTFTHFPTKKLSLSSFVTPVSYGDGLQTQVLFKEKSVSNTLKDVLSAAGKKIFTIAETEKYAHVTYFFGGGQEQPVRGENRVLIPSIPVKTYVDHPCMSAPQITKQVLNAVQNDPHDFYLINYANADMVGHSGNFKATVKAVECLDQELARLYDVIVKKMGGTLYITADHGNAEQMFDQEEQQPRTAHTTHDVPFIVVSSDCKSNRLSLNQLADIAPYILKQAGIVVPNEMKR